MAKGTGTTRSVNSGNAASTRRANTISERSNSTNVSIAEAVREWNSVTPQKLHASTREAERAIRRYGSSNAEELSEYLLTSYQMRMTDAEYTNIRDYIKTRVSKSTWDGILDKLNRRRDEFSIYNERR